MGKVLLISDDSQRAKTISDQVCAGALMNVHYLYSDDAPPCGSEFIVVDVDGLGSAAMRRLKSILLIARANGARLLFLAYGNAARAEAHAKIIAADHTIPAATPFQILGATIAQMWEQTATLPSPSAIKLTDEARKFLVQTLFSSTTITPELAVAGSGLVMHAIRDIGVGGWVSAVQRFDDATHQHCLLVAGLAAAFATSIGLGKMESCRLTKVALLHDVGKTKIPLSILNKPSSLTTEEMMIMRTHALEGYEMLKCGGFSQETLIVVRSHHEMLDGSGYPDGLLGQQIPDLVRLVTICDIYGALIERRPYKPPMPAAKACSILSGMTQRLDMDLVAAFQSVSNAIP